VSLKFAEILGSFDIKAMNPTVAVMETGKASPVNAASFAGQVGPIALSTEIL
jgi:hypothetical protein